MLISVRDGNLLSVYDVDGNLKIQMEFDHPPRVTPFAGGFVVVDGMMVHVYDTDGNRKWWYTCNNSPEIEILSA